MLGSCLVDKSKFTSRYHWFHLTHIYYMYVYVNRQCTKTLCDINKSYMILPSKNHYWVVS